MEIKDNNIKNKINNKENFFYIIEKNEKDLEKNIKSIRSVFCEFHQKMGGGKKVSDDLN
ncbi:MAG: hypothetical protein QGG39_10725 [Candidatus Poribacteria bacterium]|nr:hypothetical protein [Candidatus Poribacteria bacterium]